LGATILIYGYRIGMLISGAGALILSEYIMFSQIYLLMGCIFFFLAIFTIFLPQTNILRENTKKTNYFIWFRHHVIAPFSNFTSRQNWFFIIIFIILFKLGDAFAGIMTNPFLLELGFSKTNIAFVVKIFGLGATFIGSFIGGMLCLRYNMKFNLIFAAIIQMLTNFIFCIQAFVGYNKELLALTIGMENLAGGIGTIVFVAYISNLCNIRYTATQYALLSSLAVIPRTWFSASSGWFADYLSWIDFFLLSGLLALPAVLIACSLKKTVK
jgi:PAT family beta-lactamase induction signal transducer AmpG